MLAVKDEEERCPAGEQLKCNPQQQQQQHQQQNQTKFLTIFFFLFHKKFSSSNLSHIFLLRCFNRNTKKKQFKTSSWCYGYHTHAHICTHTHNIRILIKTHCNLPLSAILFFHGFCFCFGVRAYA